MYICICIVVYMAKAVRKRGSKGSKKSGLWSYFRRNPANAAVVVAVFLFLIIELPGFMQDKPAGSPIEQVAAPSSTLPRYLPGRNYITYGEWKAIEFKHDLGREGVNGSWESLAGGFGYLISQNYVDVMDGRYDVVFRLKVDNNTLDDKRKVVTIEVSRDRGLPVVSKDLFVGDFGASGVYQDFTLRLDTADPLNDAEFRIHFDKSPVIVSVESVSLTPA
jgi:hypothetical protein